MKNNNKTALQLAVSTGSEIMVRPLTSGPPRPSGLLPAFSPPLQQPIVPRPPGEPPRPNADAPPPAFFVSSPLRQPTVLPPLSWPPPLPAFSPLLQQPDRLPL